MSLPQLLIALSDGEFHSGDSLGDNLGVSRTAIWKQLKKIEELALPLESVKGKGYRIVGGLDLLDHALIVNGLSSAASLLLSELDLLGVVDSTNTHAMQKAVDGQKGYVCSAEKQTLGRGRRGRTWVSPYASNIYLSLVWGFGGGASSLEGLSLAVGVAVVKALGRLGIDDVQLKWPNDVLVDGRKLAGVLLEMTGDAAGPCHVVIGIGLNVAMNGELAKGIDQPWTDIKTVARDAFTRNSLLVLLLNELLPMLQAYEQEGFSLYRQSWQKLDAYKDEEVFINLGGEVVHGIAKGVDSSGAIMIETASGLRVFHGGEVSLRRASS